MSDQQGITIEHRESAHDPALDDQVDSLLSIIESMLEAMHECRVDAPVELELAAAEAREIFRQCSESLCRPFSKGDTRRLLELTLIQLCERLTTAA